MTSKRYDIDDDICMTRDLTTEDIPSLIKYLNNPALIVNTLRIPYPYTESDGAAFIENIRTSSPDSTYIFIIRLQETNELIGACGFHRSLVNERRTEIGYWLAEPYWHRSLMPKVVKAAIEIVRGQWKNLVRIEANIFPWNKASMRVAEKCGFAFEGIQRKCAHKNGEDIDEHLFALILE